MMKRMDTRALVEASILAALAAIIMIASAYIPGLMIIGIFAWPIPITYLAFKYGVRTSLMSMIVSAAIVAMIVDPVTAISVVLSYGCAAVVLGYCLNKKYSPFITIIAMSVATFLGTLLTIKLALWITGVDQLKDFVSLYNQSMKQAMDSAKSMNASQDTLNAIKNQTLSTDTVKMLLPGVLALAAVLGSYITYFFVGLTFRKLKIRINELKPMDQWYISNNLSYGLFFLVIASLVLQFVKINNASSLSMNMYIIFVFAYTVDGFAVLSWFLKSRGISNGLRIVFLILVFLMGAVTLQILLFVGIIDFALDFRKLNPQRKRIIKPRE